MKKHVNIPIFIPHLACPNDCTFCNQRIISATKSAPDVQQTDNLIQKAISTISKDQSCEIAFFGGSFTGIEGKQMCAYLACAEKYKNRISGIRLSTRPDYISEEILDILSQYSVSTIELGMQSMNDVVLSACRRGHKAEATERASKMIRERGFSLVLQMMVGLPQDTPQGVLETARQCIEMKPDAVRIYPCIVLKNTELCRQYQAGQYTPMALDEAVSLCSELLKMFEQAGISVIRLGLFSEEGLSGEDYVAGPYHPAFGELCENEIYFRKINDALFDYQNAQEVTVFVAKGELSKAIGQHKNNLNRLKKEKNIAKITIKESDFLQKRAIKVE